MSKIQRKQRPTVKTGDSYDPGALQYEPDRRPSGQHERRRPSKDHNTIETAVQPQRSVPLVQERPPLAAHPSQMESQYVNMLLALDGIPRIHNMMASFFTWILLAGFVLFPGTFSSLQGVQDNLGETEVRVLRAIQQIPLFVVAWVCTGIGAIGMCYMWWRWMNNYIWLVNSIFLPGFLNALAGVVSTLANVYGTQDGVFTTSSKITIVVTAVTAVICGFLAALYSYWKLAGVKRRHDRMIGKERAGKHGEGMVEKIKRKALETEPEISII